MKCRGLVVAGILAVCASLGSPARSAEDVLGAIREAHARLRDVKVDVARTEVHEAELSRLKRNATSALEFSKVRVYFMAPDRLRVEGKYGLVPVTLIENGNIKVSRLGLGVKRRRDVTGQPGRKQGGLEFGLLAGQVWQDYEVQLLGREDLEDRHAFVLQLKARAEPHGSFYKVWVDAENYRVLRRDRLTGDNVLKHRYLFRQPYQSHAGTWLSQRIEVYNQDSKFVGALQLTALRVNQGLAESLFGT